MGRLHAVVMDRVLDRPRQKLHVDLPQEIGVVQVFAGDLQLDPVALFERLAERRQLDLKFVTAVGSSSSCSIEWMNGWPGRERAGSTARNERLEDAAGRCCGAPLGGTSKTFTNQAVSIALDAA